MRGKMLKKLINDLVHKFILKFRVRFNIDQKHSIGGVYVDLPADHMLPVYQKKFQNYDRFVPHLVKSLPKESIVLDVGANVGDTAAAMVAANSSLKYICIEGDSDFYKYLIKNIMKIQKVYPQSYIDPRQYLVGTPKGSVALEGSGGTKHAIASDGASAQFAVPLDRIVPEEDSQRISLIKIDVDGYDHEVIESANTLLSVNEPLVYFECYYDNRDQFEAYKSA